jgi:alpha-L-fucosidase
VAAPGVSGPGIIEALQHGHADGTVWRPAEADTSIRPGWFHHPAEDGRVKSVDTLVQLYTRSVGRNSKLLLNVPPTRDGVLHDTDVSRLREFNDRLRAVFAEDLAAGRRVRRSQTRAGLPTAEIDLGRTATLDWIRLEEPVDRGQSVSRWVLEGIDGDPAGAGWRVLSRGTTIGYAKLDRVDGARPRYLRLSIEEAVAPPEPIRIRAYARPT